MTIPVQVWSDIACPWCFVGKARLDKAIKMLIQEDPTIAVHVRWRAFELDPRPREPSTDTYAGRLAKKYGRSVAQAQQMLDTMTDAIHREGGECDFSKVVAANTFDAHRLIQWAGDTDDRGETSNAQHRIKEALMRGYLGRGLDLSSHPEMLALVSEVGLDAKRAREVLASDEFAETVRNDEAHAQQYSISGVPFFVIGRYGVSGAQEATTLVDALKQAHSEIPAAEAGEGQTCGPEGCD